MGLLSKAAADRHAKPSQGGLLKIITKKYLDTEPAAEQFSRKKTSSQSQPEKTIMAKLSACSGKFGVFNGIIMEAANLSAGDFTVRLAFLVSGFGIAQELTNGRALIIFSSVQDAELIGKHLAKFVPGKNILCFKAHNPQEAFSFIKPYF